MGGFNIRGGIISGAHICYDFEVYGLAPDLQWECMGCNVRGLGFRVVEILGLGLGAGNLDFCIHCRSLNYLSGRCVILIYSCQNRPYRETLRTRPLF